MKTSQKIVLLPFDTYLGVIKNSVGAKLFRNAYAPINGKKTDLLKNGNVSCAFYVSSLLAMTGLLKNPHTTVSGTIKDLRASGWKITKNPRVGDILVWEAIDFGKNNYHRHIGFYIGNNRAISNNYKKSCPTIHSWNFRGKRK